MKLMSLAKRMVEGIVETELLFTLQLKAEMYKQDQSRNWVGQRYV